MLVTVQHGFVFFRNIWLLFFLIILLVIDISALSVVYPVATIGYILVLVPLAGMIRDILIWSNRQYIVTNRRVIQVTGVLSKEVLDTSLEKVTDVKMTQSFLGRMFDYGDIEILTASELGVN